MVPRSYYGGAWSADSRSLLLHRARRRRTGRTRCWRHRLGTPVADDVLVLEEPDERFELNVRGDPQRRPGRDLVARAGTPARSGSSTPHDPRAAPRSVGGRRHGVEYHAEHARAAGRHGRAAARHQRRRRRVPAGRSARCPRDADQDHTAWRRVAPGGPGRAARAGRRVRRATSCSAYRAGGGTGCASSPLDDLAGAGTSWCEPASTAGSLDLARNTTVRRRRGHGRATSPTCEPPVWSDVDLRDRRGAPSVHRAARRRATTRTRYVDGAPHLPGAGRHAGAGDARAAPRHPARRHRAGAALRLRRLRVRLTSRSGTPAAAQRCSTAASSSCTPTSAAAARAAGAGGSTAGWRTSSTPSTTTLAVADGLAATAWSTARRIATRGLSAGGLLQGAVFSQRPDRWRAVVAEVPFVDVVTTMFDAVDPADGQRVGRVGRPARAARSSTGCSPTRRTTTCRRPGTRPDLLVTGAVHDPRVHGARAGQVGGGAARDRPGVVAALPVPGRDRRRRPRRPVGPVSATSPTRPRSTPGSSTGFGGRY